MPLRATRTIGTGDGWDVTDSGIYIPDWAELEDVRPESIIENPQRQPIGIDLFAGAGGFSCGFKQAGWHVVAANESDVDAAHTYLCNLGSSRTGSCSAPRKTRTAGSDGANGFSATTHSPSAPRLSPGRAGLPDRPAFSRARCSSSATSAC